MNKYLLIAALAAAYYFFVVKKNTVTGKDIGNGWKLMPNGDAVGPNGEVAKYTGYATGDPYPAAGALAVIGGSYP